MKMKTYNSLKAREQYKSQDNNLAYYNSTQREVYNKIIRCLFHDCKDDFYQWLRSHTAMFQWYEDEFFQSLKEKRLFNTTAAINYVQINYK